MAHNWKRYPEVLFSNDEWYESPHQQITEDFDALVVKVVDGDTIRVTTNFRDFEFPIRFLGINAPEMNEPRGKEIKEWLENKILGKKIRVEIDINNRVGKYGRLLGKIIFQGSDLNEELLFSGRATTQEEAEFNSLTFNPIR